MISELVVVDLGKAFPGRALERAGRAFDLGIRPKMLDLGEPLVNLILAAVSVKDVRDCVNGPLVIGKLDAIISQTDVNPLGHGSDQVAHKRRSGHFSGLLVQYCDGELGRAVDGNDEILLAFGRLNLSNINKAILQRLGMGNVLLGCL